MKIAIIPGDGIGPDVTRAAQDVAVAVLPGVSFVEFPELNTKEHVATGVDIDETRLAKILACDAIFLGAVGDDLDIDFAARILLRLRFDLDLYVNLRPFSLFAPGLCPLKDPGEVDIVVVRENTEGMYTQEGGREGMGTPEESAFQVARYTRAGTERIIRYAFDFAKREGRQSVTMVDKSNVLRYGHQLWLDIFNEIRPDYPEIASNHYYVDNAAMQLIKRPHTFDVLVTTNMFGDILSDLVAQLVGGLGLAPSGNIHPGRISLFEPVHGSAPKYAGLDIANPLAAILSIIISTADSFLLVPANIVATDLYGRYYKPEASGKHLLLVSRITVVVFGILAFSMILVTGCTSLQPNSASDASAPVAVA
ncbi:hypothetical protein IIA16_05505, partial [bacterium]|nr:hypothetical protein [bacterium]